MDIRAEYGIICQRKNEKEIVKRINDFLEKECKYEKMEKINEENFSELKDKYYYRQFTEEKPLWYFELYSSAGFVNKIKFDNKNIEWLLYVLKRSVDNNTEKENEQVYLFFEKLMKAIGYKIVFLHEYKNDSEERIGNVISDGNTLK
jgi:hypothetical protein